MKQNRLIWLNGKIVNVEDANANVLSPSFQFGANVFEGIRCYWNEEKQQLYAFRLKEHYQRLQNSIRLFRMKCPYSIEEMEQYFLDTVRANQYREDIAVRQTVFVDGLGSWFSTEPVGMFISPIAKERVSHPIKKGEKTCISSWERISEREMSPRIKTGANYINSRLAKLEALDHGYDSALFLNREGYVAEGTGSCFFMIKGNTLITPLLTDSILESITRDTIIKLAGAELGMDVIERNVNRTELYVCDEAFFCGSAVEITPIIQMDSYRIGDGEPGRLTQEIHKQYLDVVTGNEEKHRDWLTPIYQKEEI
ncbi:MAG: branched-chain amino acid transaminase [Clostridium sp.]|nr:branched-chain amino acid transaminase [Clostridium sp.]